MAESDETKRWTPATDFCRSFWCEKIKLVISTIVVNLLVVVVFVGVANGYGPLKIPAVANFMLLFVALTLLASCEALRYAVVSIEKWDMAQV
jgi:ABC-type transport system involved in cytochrome bd biosynthesis fused ATPase/permease subunit